jgi:hypothetical protein
MTWFLALLGASVFSSILVLAAGILSSRMNRREDYVETFYVEAVDLAGPASQPTE